MREGGLFHWFEHAKTPYLCNISYCRPFLCCRKGLSKVICLRSVVLLKYTGFREHRLLYECFVDQTSSLQESWPTLAHAIFCWVHAQRVFFAYRCPQFLHTLYFSPMYFQHEHFLQVRMQLGAGGGHPVAAAKLVYGEAGLRGMYAGLSAAVTRQAVYTTLRVGLYDWIRVRERGAGGGRASSVARTWERQRKPSYRMYFVQRSEIFAHSPSFHLYDTRRNNVSPSAW